MKISDTMLKPEEAAIFRLRSLYSRYGYAQFKMSKFEEYDLYVRNKNFLISDSVITFTDTNGKLMALKPDVTLSIVKNSKYVPGQVQKVYYDENVYRISAKNHSFSEILQVGLECHGDIDDYCLGEVLMLAKESLSQISEDYILDVSHLGILSAVIDRVGVSPDGRRRLLDCIAHKSLHEADAVCREEGIWDERAELLKHLNACSGSAVQAFQKLYALFSDAEWYKTVKQFEEIVASVADEHVRVDFSVVNDMSYYNGIVFQGFVKGIPESILSGGQYDRLMQRMEKKSGAVGFAVYLDQLEDLAQTKRPYDVDTVLLYDASVPTSAVRREVERLAGSGVSITAQKSVPEKLSYRQLLKVTESGVEILETNA